MSVSRRPTDSEGSGPNESLLDCRALCRNLSSRLWHALTTNPDTGSAAFSDRVRFKEGPERQAVYSLTILLAFPRSSTSYPCLLTSSTCWRVFSQILSDQTGLGLTGRVFAGTVSWAVLYPEGLTGLSGNDGFEGIDGFNPFGIEGLTVEVTPCCCGLDCRVDLGFLFNPSLNPRLEIFVLFNPCVALELPLRLL